MQPFALDKSNVGRHAEAGEGVGQRQLDIGGKRRAEGAGAGVHQSDHPFHRGHFRPQVIEGRLPELLSLA